MQLLEGVTASASASESVPLSVSRSVSGTSSTHRSDSKSTTSTTSSGSASLSEDIEVDIGIGDGDIDSHCSGLHRLRHRQEHNIDVDVEGMEWIRKGGGLVMFGRRCRGYGGATAASSRECWEAGCPV